MRRVAEKRIVVIGFFAALLIILASRPIVPAEAEAGLVTLDPSDPHRFLMVESPWHLTGYYPAIATMANPKYQDYYKDFIDKLSTNNINYFRNVFSMGQPFGNFTDPYERTGPGIANDGGPKFDLTKFNQTYFDYWRDVISYAKSKGVVVQVCIFDSWHTNKWVMENGGHITREWGIKHDFYCGANNINGINASTTSDLHNPQNRAFEYRKAFIRKTVDSVGDLPNIIYEISNENHYNLEWEMQLADYLTEYETSKGYGPHLVMPRDLPNHDLNGTIVAGFGVDYKINNSHMHNEVASLFSMNKPIIVDNDGGGMLNNADDIRERAWAALTAGGYLSYFHFDLYEPGILEFNSTSDSMKYVGFTRQFLEDYSVDMRGMGPRDDLVSNGWCYAEEGKRYIVYLSSGGSTTISGLPESYAAYWFNPLDGSSQVAHGGPVFTASSSDDWVLYIDSMPP